VGGVVEDAFEEEDAWPPIAATPPRNADALSPAASTRPAGAA
jgi:hypothetical protein